MELALSLGGDTPKPFSFLDKSHEKMVNKDLGFCMGLGPLISGRSEEETVRAGSSLEPTVQLDLLPFSPVSRSKVPSKVPFPWLTENLLSESTGSGRGLDVNRMNRLSLGSEDREDGASLSSGSSFQMDLSIYTSNGRGNKRAFDTISLNEMETDQRRTSDEEENGLNRKKLRLSKQQSAFLEESFKEHNTLNPREKLALAKQLNLRPRQVEVWFQNRRARTKLKQTEVDCEYLKKCCETLTEENRRLQKEVQELRAFKATQPFYMQPPATTLTMCPSCERRVPSTPAASATATTTDNTKLSLSKPRLSHFTNSQALAQKAAS